MYICKGVLQTVSLPVLDDSDVRQAVAAQQRVAVHPTTLPTCSIPGDSLMISAEHSRSIGCCLGYASQVAGHKCGRMAVPNLCISSPVDAKASRLTCDRASRRGDRSSSNSHRNA